MDNSRLGMVAAAMLASGCGSGDVEGVPGDAGDARPFAGIGEDETIRLVGNEPFWGGAVEQGLMTYTTPDDLDGTTIPVERFAGRGGVSFSGQLGDESLDLTVTPGECSDGMSGRVYPFTATLLIGAEQRNGCAWTDAQPFAGPEAS